MPSDNLRDTVKKAYFPYVKAFLRRPEQARLYIEIDEYLVYAELQLARTDLKWFEERVERRAEQRRAFNNLVRRLDPNGRGPFLDFVLNE